MANPQLDNGYIRIANELYIEIYKADLSASELRIVLFIMYQTYGFNKKTKKLSANYISNSIGIPVKTIRRAISTLIDKNILVAKSNGKNNTAKSYGIQKDYEKWVLKNEYTPTQKKVSPQMSSPLPTNGVLKNEPLGTQKCVFDYSKMSTNKRQYNKDNIIKDSSSRTTTDQNANKPTLDDVFVYVRKKGYRFDPTKFFRYYEIIGWKYKGAPIENWKALADRWNDTENVSCSTSASYDIEELEKIE